MRIWILLLTLLGFPLQAEEPLRVAVAANFKPTLEHLLQENGHLLNFSVTVSAGSTGALHAQIRNGAPFDVFLAADQIRPAKLE